MARVNPFTKIYNYFQTKIEKRRTKSKEEKVAKEKLFSPGNLKRKFTGKPKTGDATDQKARFSFRTIIEKILPKKDTRTPIEKFKELVNSFSEEDLNEKGIFRLSGNEGQLKKFQQGKIELKSLSVHDRANLLKRAFDDEGSFKLPDPDKFYDGEKFSVDKAKEQINEMPEESRKAFKAMFQLMHKVNQNEESNLMTTKNLGICFGPRFPSKNLYDPKGTQVTTALLDNYEAVFEEE